MASAQHRPPECGSKTSLPASRPVVSEPSSATRRSRVTGVTHDSQAVVPGVLFACIVGAHHDGHAFAPSAVESGASALLVERELPVAVTQVVVDDTRAVLGHVAAAFHGEPSRSLTTVGITGTNGKTTTAHLIAAALRSTGHDVGVIGTLSGVRTTPEATELQARLAGMRDDGVDSVVMEVSSHALALWRVAGTWFDAAVFTNLGRDHLDLHGSVEDYFRAKARLVHARAGGGRCDQRRRSVRAPPAGRREHHDAALLEVRRERDRGHRRGTPVRLARPASLGADRRGVQRDELVGCADRADGARRRCRRRGRRSVVGETGARSLRGDRRRRARPRLR